MMNRDMINSMKHGPAAWTVLHCTLSKDAIYYNDIMLPPVQQQDRIVPVVVRSPRNIYQTFIWKQINKMAKN